MAALGLSFDATVYPPFPELPRVAYKVLTAEQLGVLLATGEFAGAPVDLADGFVHLSTADQLTGTVDRHFAGQAELHVAAVDLSGCDVRWEVSRGGQRFPHLYGGPLRLDRVTAHEPLSRGPDGQVHRPG